MDYIIPWPDMLARLGIAFLLGALIGLERERHQRPAGLRTHILVSVASALFTMVSIVAATDGSDPGRIAAQIVTGIGFLGAGTIMRHGSVVRGLTTAASLWMAAALGMAAGFGWFVAAGATAIIAFIALTVVKVVEERLPHADPLLSLLIQAEPGKDPLPAMLTALRAMHVRLEKVGFGEESLADGMHIIVFVQAPRALDAAALVQTLTDLDGVAEVGPAK